jgi:pimeloyl-ACP methyl ester carboxylesterase
VNVEEVVHLNGVSLFSRTVGNGPNVIVFHGGPGAHHDYLLPQFDLLATGRRLRAPRTRSRNPQAMGVRAGGAPYFPDPERAGDLTPFRVTGRTQDDVWRSLGDCDLTGELERIRVPALVVHGRHDPIPLWSAEDTARRLNARLVVLDASGHVPYVEETARFISELDRFLPRSA